MLQVFLSVLLVNALLSLVLGGCSGGYCDIKSGEYLVFATHSHCNIEYLIVLNGGTVSIEGDCFIFQAQIEGALFVRQGAQVEITSMHVGHSGMINVREHSRLYGDTFASNYGSLVVESQASFFFNLAEISSGSMVDAYGTIGGGQFIIIAGSVVYFYQSAVSDITTLHIVDNSKFEMDSMSNLFVLQLDVIRAKLICKGTCTIYSDGATLDSGEINADAVSEIAPYCDKFAFTSFGGSHAGCGGQGNCCPTGITKPYSAINNPILQGSRGGSGCAQSGDFAKGGGALRLTIYGLYATGNSIISARGGSATSPNYSLGGGSGGSIFLETNCDDPGSIYFSVEGGDGFKHPSEPYGFGGSGGRIFLACQVPMSSAHEGKFLLSGGKNAHDKNFGSSGTAFMVYNNAGMLYVNDSPYADRPSEYFLPTYALLSSGAYFAITVRTKSKGDILFYKHDTNQASPYSGARDQQVINNGQGYVRDVFPGNTADWAERREPVSPRPLVFPFASDCEAFYGGIYDKNPVSASASSTPSKAPSPSNSPSSPASNSNSSTVSATPTPSQTGTRTPTSAPSQSGTPSSTVSASGTGTRTSSSTVSASGTGTGTPSNTRTPSPSATTTSTKTLSATPSPSAGPCVQSGNLRIRAGESCDYPNFVVFNTIELEAGGSLSFRAGFDAQDVYVTSANLFRIYSSVIKVKSLTVKMSSVDFADASVTLHVAQDLFMQASVINAADAVINVSGTLELDAASSINVSAKGYSSPAWPSNDGGDSRNQVGNGGVHASCTGDLCALRQSSTLLAYGSAFVPILRGLSGTGPNRGYGGGRLELRVGTLKVAGSIYANGGNGSFVSGGGAGGSIYIRASSIKAVPRLYARGGDVALSGVPGSGGRIAVHTSDAASAAFMQSDSVFSVRGGAYPNGNFASPGTYFFRVVSGNSYLTTSAEGTIQEFSSVFVIIDPNSIPPTNVRTVPNTELIFTTSDVAVGCPTSLTTFNVDQVTSAGDGGFITSGSCVNLVIGSYTNTSTSGASALAAATAANSEYVRDYFMYQFLHDKWQVTATEITSSNQMLSIIFAQRSSGLLQCETDVQACLKGCSFSQYERVATPKVGDTVLYRVIATRSVSGVITQEDVNTAKSKIPSYLSSILLYPKASIKFEYHEVRGTSLILYYSVTIPTNGAAPGHCLESHIKWESA